MQREERESRMSKTCGGECPIGEEPCIREHEREGEYSTCYHSCKDGHTFLQFTRMHPW